MFKADYLKNEQSFQSETKSIFSLFRKCYLLYIQNKPVKM